MAEEELEQMGEAEEEGGAQEESGGKGLGGSKIVKILIYVAAAILGLFLMAGISYLVSNYMMEAS
jgi:hypothetical protein